MYMEDKMNFVSKIFKKLVQNSKKEESVVTPVNLPLSTNEIQSSSNLVEKKDAKIIVSANDLDYNDVIKRYLATDHSKVKAIYDYYSYYKAEFECILKNIPVFEVVLNDEKVLRNKEILSPFEKSSVITKRSNIGKISNFVVLDVETTGIAVGGNDIIEISAIKFERFKPIAVFQTLLKPRKPIPKEATDINGITNEMVANCPSFAQIKSSFEKFIGSNPIVAHNASFDIKFLHVSGLVFPDNTKFYDTLELSKRHIKDYAGEKLDSYKLSDVCDECCIHFDGAHRSTSDALATGLLFIEIIKHIFETDSILEIM